MIALKTVKTGLFTGLRVLAGKPVADCHRNDSVRCEKQ